MRGGTGPSNCSRAPHGQKPRARCRSYGSSPRFADLRKREFAGEDNPGEPLLRCPEHAIGVMDGHLGGGMEGEVRDDLPCERSDTGVLHEHGINTGCIKPDQVFRDPFEFAVVDEGIDRDIDPDPVGMGKPDPFLLSPHQKNSLHTCGRRTVSRSGTPHRHPLQWLPGGIRANLPVQGVRGVLFFRVFCLSWGW